jgi:hypothetical protein
MMISLLVGLLLDYLGESLASMHDAEAFAQVEKYDARLHIHSAKK